MPEVLSLRGSFPLRRETRFLTQLNRLDDGTEYRFPEQTSRLCRWDIDLRNATAEQAVALEQFFGRVQGRYEPFAFLDPMENLLCWSQNFTQPAWEKSEPLAAHLGGQVSDPQGGSGGQQWGNTSSEANTFTQWLEFAPAGLELTASIWLRGQSAPAVSVGVIGDQDEGNQQNFPVTGEWKRYSCSWRFPSDDASERAAFRLGLPANSTVDLFGAQLMALPCPGDYTKTTDVSGLHPRCRFGSDLLRTRYTAPGVANAKVSIVELT